MWPLEQSQLTFQAGSLALSGGLLQAQVSAAAPTPLWAPCLHAHGGLRLPRLLSTAGPLPGPHHLHCPGFLHRPLGMLVPTTAPPAPSLPQGTGQLRSSRISPELCYGYTLTTPLYYSTSCQKTGPIYTPAASDPAKKTTHWKISPSRASVFLHFLNSPPNLDCSNSDFSSSVSSRNYSQCSRP